ncbi:MAG: hypothetical protein ACFFBD_28825, partial [Candidatus Hodarchaeota archaeon]
NRTSGNAIVESTEEMSSTFGNRTWIIPLAYNFTGNLQEVDKIGVIFSWYSGKYSRIYVLAQTVTTKNMDTFYTKEMFILKVENNQTVFSKSIFDSLPQIEQALPDQQGLAFVYIQSLTYNENQSLFNIHYGSPGICYPEDFLIYDENSVYALNTYWPWYISHYQSHPNEFLTGNRMTAIFSIKSRSGENIFFKNFTVIEIEYAKQIILSGSASTVSIPLGLVGATVSLIILVVLRLLRKKDLSIRFST